MFSPGKAPGSGTIPVETYKSGGPHLIKKLSELFQSLWKLEADPQERKDASVIQLYLSKGDLQICTYHRTISPLSTAGKTLEKIL